VEWSTSSISSQHSSLLDNAISSVLDASKELTMQSLLSSNCHTREKTSTVSTATSSTIDIMQRQRLLEILNQGIAFTHCCHFFSVVLLCCQVPDIWYSIVSGADPCTDLICQQFSLAEIRNKEVNLLIQKDNSKHRGSFSMSITDITILLARKA
jgi:hypothetical protein